MGYVRFLRFLSILASSWRIREFAHCRADVRWGWWILGLPTMYKRDTKQWPWRCTLGYAVQLRFCTWWRLASTGSQDPK